MKKTIVSIFLVVFLVGSSLLSDAQSFTEVTGLPIIPMVSSQHDWGDYDNDGDLDLLVSGNSTTIGNITRLYENLGNDSFRIDSINTYLDY